MYSVSRLSQPSRRLGRPGRVAALVAFVVTLFAVVALDDAPASAGGGCTPRTCQGNRTRGGYAASALLSATGGGGPPGVPVPCSIDWQSATEGRGRPLDPPVTGHVEVFSYVSSFPDEEPSYTVSVMCIENGHSGPSNGDPGTPGWWEYDLLEMYFDVVPLDPDEIIEEALANLEVGAPVIETSPGDGLPSMVGIDTWLMIDEASWGPAGPVTTSDGPLSVTVWATPDDNGDVIWNTGDGGEETCTGNGQDPQGSCSHVYERSSAGLPDDDDQGRPAYAVTASVDYTGGYAVYVLGVEIGRVDDLGEITRTSPPHLLAVEEAQALNTVG